MRTMKNYYQILGVDENFSDDQIRRNYRKLAMQYHPDRNPGSSEAEEKFKEIAEAYGVLTDPEKRRQYDTMRRFGGDRAQPGADGFQFRQEDILRDLFQNAQFQQMLHGLFGEFQRSGFRGNSQFIRQIFFGGGKGLFIGGVLLFGTLGGSRLLGPVARKLITAAPLLLTAGKTLKNMLSKGKSPRSASESRPSQMAEASPDTLDLHYQVPLTAEQLASGKKVRISTGQAGNTEVLQVMIPAGSRDGQILRLQGRGIVGAKRRGDLYLHLVLNSQA